MQSGNVGNNSNQPVQVQSTPEDAPKAEQPAVSETGSAFSNKRKVSVANREALEKITGQQARGQRAPDIPLGKRIARGFRNFKDSVKRFFHINTGSYTPDATKAKLTDSVKTLQKDIATEAAKAREALQPEGSTKPKTKPPIAEKPAHLKKPATDDHPNKLHDTGLSTEAIYDEIPALKTEETASAIGDEEQIQSDLEMLNNLRKELRTKNKGFRARRAIVKVLRKHDQLKKEEASLPAQREFLRAQYNAITEKFGKTISKAKVQVAPPITARVPQKIAGQRLTPPAPPVPAPRKTPAKSQATSEPTYSTPTTSNDRKEPIDHIQAGNGDEYAVVDRSQQRRTTPLAERKAASIQPEKQLTTQVSSSDSTYDVPRSTTGSENNIYSTPSNIPADLESQSSVTSDDIPQWQRNLAADLHVLKNIEANLVADRKSDAWKAVVKILEKDQKQAETVSGDKRAKAVAKGLQKVLANHQKTIESHGLLMSELLDEADDIRRPDGSVWSQNELE